MLHSGSQQSVLHGHSGAAAGATSSSAGDVLALFGLGDGARPTWHDRTDDFTSHFQRTSVAEAASLFGRTNSAGPSCESETNQAATHGFCLALCFFVVNCLTQATRPSPWCASP